jgi:beta-lactamase regulating signal transducer with metallopeptidase domain
MVLAQDILYLLWAWTWKGALVLLVTAAVARPLAWRWPAWSALLWSGAFGLLFLLPLTALMATIQAPWDGWMASHRLVTDTALPLGSVVEPVVEPVVEKGEVGVDGASVAGAAVVRSFSSPDWSSRGLSSWVWWFIGLYLSGVVISLLLVGLGLWRLAGLRRRAMPLDEGIMVPFCRRLGLKRRIGLALSDEVSTPSVIGFWRPLVLLPRLAYDPVRGAVDEHVLLHELAHVKRFDLQINWLGQVVAAFYWHVPLVHWGRRELGRVREFVCDDWVRRECGQRQERVCDYAETLTRAATGLPVGGARLGLAMARLGGLQQRIERLLGRPAASPRIPLKMAVPVLGALMLCGTVLGRLDAVEASPQAVTLKGVIRNAPTAVVPFRYERGIVPIGSVEGDIHLLPGGEFSLTLPMDRPKLVRVGEGKKMVYLFLEPGDHLRVDVDWGADKLVPHFNGGAAENNRFVAEVVQRFGIGLDVNFRNLKAEPFRQAMDRRRRQMQAFFQEGTDRYDLTPALVDFYGASVAYGWSYELVSYPLFYTRYRDSFDEEEFYDSFWDELQLVDPQAINSPYYYRFINMYMERIRREESRQQLAGGKASANVSAFALNYDRAAEILQDRVLYWYMAGQVVSGLYQGKTVGLVSNLMQTLSGRSDEERRQEAWSLALQRYAHFKNINPYPEYAKDVDWVLEKVMDL